MFGGYSPFNHCSPYNNNPYNNNYNYMYGQQGGTSIPQQNQQVTNTNKIFVNGLEDVRNIRLTPGSDFMFLDNDKPLLYQKVVDNKGQFEVKTFDIMPHIEKQETKPSNEIPEKYVSLEKFNDLSEKLTLLINEVNDLKDLKDLLNKGEKHEPVKKPIVTKPNVE